MESSLTGNTRKMRALSWKNHLFFFLFLFPMLHGCSQENSGAFEKVESMNETMNQGTLKIATFGGGCFWCTEAVYSELRGVDKVVSGYAGGSAVKPTYADVCSGKTGHAEVIQLTYDPSVISFAEILEVHWKTHDPTTLNRQGGDVGTQYRSVIFYHDDEQKKIAEASKSAATESGLWDAPIVTEIKPFDVFYPAEEYHQDYFSQNPEQGYCVAVVAPKVEKFRKAFQEKLKSNGSK